MKRIHKMVAVINSLAFLIILLLSAFEIAAYSDYEWYETEYEKYAVLDELDMEMADVMNVTEEMMKYLRGNRDDLVVYTVVDGNEQEFFNETEKAHMRDVQHLFIGGLWVRRFAIAFFVISLIILVKTNAKWQVILPKSFLISLGSFIVVTIGLGILFVSDFDKYFTLFHEIAFKNDLWLLDYDTDLLIRMLPEGFFLDMVVRIGVIFLILMSITLLISIGTLVWQKNKKN